MTLTDTITPRYSGTRSNHNEQMSLYLPVLQNCSLIARYTLASYLYIWFFRSGELTLLQIKQWESVLLSYLCLLFCVCSMQVTRLQITDCQEKLTHAFSNSVKCNMKIKKPDLQFKLGLPFSFSLPITVTPPTRHKILDRFLKLAYS